MSRLHLGGGERCGVGKSVFARLLVQYCIEHKLPANGFDTDGSHGALLRFYEVFRLPVDVGDFAQLVRLVDALECRHGEVVVDLAAQTEAPLARWIDAGEVFSLIAELGHVAISWYVIDDGKDSTRLLERHLESLDPHCRLVCVRNFGRGRDFDGFEDAKLGDRIKSRGDFVLDLPALDPRAMHKIDRLDKSFWGAVYNTDAENGPCLSLMERRRVRVFVANVHDQLGRVLRQLGEVATP